MTQRRAKLSLGPDGQQKPPPEHKFSNDAATDDPPAKGGRDGHDDSQASSPSPGAAASRGRPETDNAGADAKSADNQPSETGSGPSAALPPAAGRLLRHPAVRIGLLGAAAALSIWLLRRRLF